MLRLILENVRTFAQRVEIPLRPLTVLTGENSSGKTTFLAALAAVCDPERFPFSPGFNRAPYNLGSFDTIATYKGGKYGRAKAFTIGYEDTDAPTGNPHRAIATFRNANGQPALASFELTSPRGKALLTVDEEPAASALIEVDLHGRKGSTRYEFRREIGEARPLSFPQLLLTAYYRFKGAVEGERFRRFPELYDLASVFSPSRAISIAPIRSKPERTYGDVSETFEPTGDHIPFLLERLVQERPDSPETKAVLNGLTRFGEESGLFKKIEVRKLGNKPDDPFQLLVTMEARAANLIDVGYGVSQALPVVVQSVLGAPTTRFLLQQPEVHLHPRAQAALGTFFVDLVTNGQKQFVIETHSDFIIDRIRQHVAAGELHPKDLLILFFERQKSETVIHQLTVDESGNILNAPRSYRDFFVQEEWRLLTRATGD